MPVPKIGHHLLGFPESQQPRRCLGPLKVHCILPLSPFMMSSDDWLDWAAWTLKSFSMWASSFPSLGVNYYCSAWPHHHRFNQSLPRRPCQQRILLCQFSSWVSRWLLRLLFQMHLNSHNQPLLSNFLLYVSEFRVILLSHYFRLIFLRIAVATQPRLEFHPCQHHML